MENWGLVICLVVLLVLPQICSASIQLVGTMNSGSQASQMGYIDNNGMFLLSNDSKFAFGFKPTQDVTLFLLVIIHQDSSTVIWTANRGTPVTNSDNFVFDTKGSVSLQAGGKVVWAPETGGKRVSSIRLENSGNLVFIGSDNSSIVWQSFSHPTDTLISNQEFTQGMKLASDPDVDSRNLTYFLGINSGDLNLYAGYKNPQVYWSMAQDTRKIINKDGGEVSLARIEANSWKFYDRNKVLLWQFVFSTNPSPVNSTWIAVLENDGFITFNSLGQSKTSSSVMIPSDSCGTPEPCDPYEACSSNKCQCPSGLLPLSCKTGISSPCGDNNAPLQLLYAGDGLSYFALGFVQPSSKRTTLNGCKASCANNCLCLALFFDNSSGSCYLFDRLGSFLSDSTSKYTAYVKVSTIGNGPSVKGNSNSKHLPIIIVIVILTLLIILGMIYGGYRYHLKKRKMPESLVHETSDQEDNFLGSLSGMPVRYSYKELQDATNNFSEKLGQGGFGSVYKGVLPDGTRIAVKQLEGIGQGKKEFRAEVSIIGSIHHVHLVRLRGFCAEGTHRLLAYEFMGNGSLDKWIFKRKKDNDSVLDWETRFNIAVGTAKGLAYLHEDCDVKILHCDIKPENVLLDDHFEAKVSDFGLAKLMAREQSNVFTTLRGTRGYLAPEWILNYPISEKSDVYSFGMVLLEIIGGRKNYDPQQSLEKSHFPSYAFKMMEQGKLEEILDSTLKYKPNDESVQTAIKVALWCIQEEVSMRPSMIKVVQMLEGISPAPHPPMSSFSGTRLFTSFFKSGSDEGTATGTSSGPSDCNSDAYMSAERLSGPR